MSRLKSMGRPAAHRAAASSGNRVKRFKQAPPGPGFSHCMPAPETLHFTFHSWMPADHFSCIVTSSRIRAVVTGVKRTVFQASFAVP